MAVQRDQHAFLPDRKEEWITMSSPSVRRELSVIRKQIEILVVESDPADTRLTEVAFRAAGLTSGFRSVSDGADALAYVHKEGQYANVATPDLIFLDLSLPRVSGLEVFEGDQINAPPDADPDCRRFRL